MPPHSVNVPVSPASGAQAIISAAAELFAQSGFEAVSVAEIANRAGVSKANVFHHFKSKDALYLEVMSSACQGHAQFTEQLLAADLSSAEKLRQMIRYDFEDMFANPQRTQLFLREVFNCGHGEGRRPAEQVFEHNFNVVVALFKQGQARGEFRADLDPAVAAWVVGSAVMMFFQSRETLRRIPAVHCAECPEDYAEKMLDILLNGLISREFAAASSAPAH